MAEITGFTADRMKIIEDTTVVDGEVNDSGELVLLQRNGTPIVAGNVIGPQGPPGAGSDVDLGMLDDIYVNESGDTMTGDLIGPSGVLSHNEYGASPPPNPRKGDIWVTPSGPTPGVYANPVGSITLFAGATAPPGWLLCRGQEVSRATYSDLFSVLDVVYGAGNGTTTFNLPNLTDRVPLGAGNRNRGTTGGAETVALTAAQMPAHDHGAATGAAGGHGHQLDATDTNHLHDLQNHSHIGAAGLAVTEVELGGNIAQGGATARGVSSVTKNNVLASVNTPSPNNTGWMDRNNAHGHPLHGVGDHTHSLASNGSGAAHNNMQPFITLNYIIRAVA